MKILVTGAAGYIGHKLALCLADEGHTVHALVRSVARANHLQHSNIILFEGDVMQKQSLLPAMQGCTQLYHAAAKVGAWAKRPQDFYDVNVTGTAHVLDAAIQAGVQKVVFTSTAGVFGPSVSVPVDEEHQRTLPFRIDYDRSKKEAEALVPAYLRKGLPVVIVSPAKVYGPGYTSHSLTANAIIGSFLKKGITFIPYPGSYKVSFAFADDVVKGHVLAMEKGRAGETFILGGNNVSYAHFFGTIRKLAGSKGRILAVPKPLIKAAAYAQEISHRLTGSPIRFPANSVDHLFSNYTFSSEKAIRQLGYQITPLEEALHQTIHFLKNDPHA
jgi:nucleoside-diphosphate-sugar epimerase